MFQSLNASSLWLGFYEPDFYKQNSKHQHDDDAKGHPEEQTEVFTPVDELNLELCEAFRAKQPWSGGLERKPEPAHNYQKTSATEFRASSAVYSL